MKLTFITAFLFIAIGLIVFRQIRQPENANVQELVVSKQPVSQYTDLELATTSGRFRIFSPEELGAALELPDNKVVLFFNASWCPTCQVAKKAFAEQANRLPENLTILDVDYDSNEDLRKQYSVTTQHTYVQIDKDGNLLKKWTGSYVPAQLVGQVV